MSTRSGIIYNKQIQEVVSKRTRQSSKETQEPRKSPRQSTRPEFFEPKATYYQDRPKRSNRTAFSEEMLRELCEDEDNDSTSDYDCESENYRYFLATPPKYEVNIDFDGASAAWRSNKRRVGESWVYKRTTNNLKEQAAKLVSEHIQSSVVVSSVASRVKEMRRGQNTSI